MSKRMDNLKTKVDKTKVYSLDEAVKLVKETSAVKFDAGVEVHACLGIDPKKGEQQIRATVVLPHGLGKSKKVLVIAGGEKVREAESAGADLIAVATAGRSGLGRTVLGSVAEHVFRKARLPVVLYHPGLWGV